MRRRGPRAWRRAAVVALVVFAVGLAWYGVVAVAWAAGTGEKGRPPVGLLLVASVVFTAALPAVRGGAEKLAVRWALGQHADSYELVVGFLHRMANTMAVDDVLPRLAEAAARTVHSDRGEVRVLLADGRQQRQVWPPEAAGSDDLVTVPVRHRGATVGQLGVEAAGAAIPSADRRLLDDLAGPAGLALTSVRLTVELRRRLGDVEQLTAALDASQRRLIEARRREQERIRAQAERRLVPHLDDLARHLAAAEGAAGGDRSHVGTEGGAGRGLEGRSDRELEGQGHGRDRSLDKAFGVVADEEVGRCLTLAGEAAAAALEALRQLSRSVFSPVLSDSGIKAALRAWADQSGVALTIRSDGDLSALHDRPAIEAALHFTCVAALELTTPSTVDIAVDDRGAGVSLPWPVGPDAPADTDDVWQLLADRSDALGGWVRTDSQTGLVHAWIPFEADPAGGPVAVS